MKKVKAIILGAAGRDFHNFNIHFRDNPSYRVVAFTAAQIPNISNRVYPPELAGRLYPKGIPIHPEEQLPQLIERHGVNEVTLAYSDLSYEEVMHKASIALAKGANFLLLGPETTMLEARVPVIAICAVRTGSGKGTVARRIIDLLPNKRVVVIRHPMPYGNLLEEAVERYATLQDLDKYHCTIEEREEFEPYLAKGAVVYAGVDYTKILEKAEKEADIILWEGGNNDLPFIKPDLHIVVADPLRPGHELRYYPSEANVRMAHVLVINKVDSATRESVEQVRSNIKMLNPDALIIEAQSQLTVDNPQLIQGKEVLVVEDGPTVTHGELPTAAGYTAARRFQAKLIVNPKPYAVGSLTETYQKYSHLGPVLPTMGYSESQIKEIEETIKRTPCDSVIISSPIDIRRIMKVEKPIARVKYELKEVGEQSFLRVIDQFLKSSEALY